VLSHAAAMFACALPVSIGDLGNDFAAFFYSIENRTDIDVAIESALYPNLDLVKVYKYSDL